MYIAPTGPPSDVAAMSSGNSITVSWAPVPCLLRNSEITGYVVHRATSSEVPGSVSSAVIEELEGSTQYSIEVAAVGAGETGVFSDAVTAEATAATAAEATATAATATTATAGESEWLGFVLLCYYSYKVGLNLLNIICAVYLTLLTSYTMLFYFS